MRKTISCIIIIILLIICAACAPSDNSAINIADVEAKELLMPARDQKTLDIAAAANDFAFKLSSELAKNAGDESFVCSPISVWLPLAALTNAMDEQAAQSTASLGAGASASEVNAAASRMLQALLSEQSEEGHVPLSFANAVFVNRSATLRQGFVQSFADCYRGTAINVDFTAPEAVNAVNSWAKEKTNGIIPEIVQGFEPDTVAAIANAVYFSDRWHWEFDPNETVEDVFHAPGGDTQASYMLREADMLTYYEDDRVQAMPLTFKLGGGMLVMLPKDGDANGLLASMTHDYFQEIRNDSIHATGKLLLPRFSIDEGVIDLRPALEALGLSNLFDMESAPLNGLIEEDMPVWLSGAVQRARIEVDEKGTTAAAITLVPAPGAMMPEPTEPFEMKCDRPFVFIIYKSGMMGEQILFTGVVNKIDER